MDVIQIEFEQNQQIQQRRRIGELQEIIRQSAGRGRERCFVFGILAGVALLTISQAGMRYLDEQALEGNAIAALETPASSLP